MYIDLDQAQTDWITATSFETEFWEFWTKKLREEGEAKPSKILQYTGEFFRFGAGSAFLGTGEQKGGEHHMLRLSGNLSNELSRFVWSQRRQGFIRVTRLDLQITIREPHDWSQWRLFNRIKKKKKHVGWVESSAGRAGQLETVYIGNRKSDRMTRVYIKLTAGNNRLVRFETEYKGDRANAIARAIAVDGEMPDNYLRYELEQVINDRMLVVAFVPALIEGRAVTEKIRVESSHEKTSRWLLEQCLPSFSRIINDHDGDGRVLEAFQDAINKAHFWRD